MAKRLDVTRSIEKNMLIYMKIYIFIYADAPGIGTRFSDFLFSLQIMFDFSLTLM